MKIKVSPKNFAQFIIYSIILFYFCALAVVNLAELANSNHFYGLLPLKVFTSVDYLIVTIALFVGVLLFIFTSVSSYIFSKDKEKGWGIKLSEKSSDGYSDWSSEKDIKNDAGMEKVNATDMHITAAGIPLINHGNEMWVDNGEYHNLVIGATGSGKTQCVVKPLVNLLSKKGESMIITDPKGELYEYAGDFLKKQGYRIIVLNFRSPENGNSWNPLTLPYTYYKEGNKDKSTELLEDVALNIIYDKDNKDPFWEKSSADYFSGLTLGLFQDANEKEVNLNSINVMSTIGEERRGASTYIKEYFQMKGEQSPAYIFASNTINAPNETKGGILSTFRQKIRQFSTKESLSEMLSYSDFDMRDIGKEKTAVFMLIHDEKKTYHGLMTIFIKQCYECLIDCAQKNGGKLEYRTNFILDEFANMPPLKDVDAMVTAARSRDIRFTFIIQNFAQLNDVYGEQVAQVIKGNCGNLVYLISTELKALEEISKMCGEVKSKEKDKTASTPLVTISDLQKLELFQAIIIRWRKSPFKTKLAPDFKINWGIERSKAELPTREIQPVEIFDIKKFVSEQKKDEVMAGGIGMMGGNPFMSGGFNPFAGGMGPMGSPMGGSPMGGKPSSPMGGPNPYDSMSNKDIDDIVKDIEKKLKELDEEEERENQAKLNEPKDVKKDDDFKVEKPNISSEVNRINTVPMNDTPEAPNFSIEEAIRQIEKQEAAPKEEADTLDLTQEIKIDDLDKPIINVDKDSVVVNDNVITDDEFYDDFFDDN